MKKGIKTAVIVALGCIAAGGVLMGAGIAAGGREQLERGEFDYIHLDEDEVDSWLGRLILTGARSGRKGEGSYDGEPEEEGVEVLSGDFDREIAYSGRLNQLETDVGIHILEIRKGNTGKVRIEGKNCDRIQCYVKDGTLYVKDVGKNKKYTHINNRELVLTIPGDIRWEDVEMEVFIGGVEMENLEAEQVELDVSMGNIEIDGLKADHLEIEVSMGNVEITDAETGSLDAETDMGNIDFSGVVDGGISAYVNMGSIALELKQERTDFDYEISADMGSVTLDGEDYSGLSTAWHENNGAGRKLEADSSMGSIDISLKQR